jgi:general secretion pathway protein E
MNSIQELIEFSAELANVHVEPVIAPMDKIGAILVELGKLDMANLDRALKVQESARAETGSKEKLGSVLSRLGMISSRVLAEALSAQHGWKIVEATEFPELPILEDAVSPRFLREAGAIPIAETDEEVVLAMTDPADVFTLRAFQAATNKRVVSRLLSETDFETVYERMYGSGKSGPDR